MYIITKHKRIMEVDNKFCILTGLQHVACNKNGLVKAQDFSISLKRCIFVLVSRRLKITCSGQLFEA